MRHKIKILGLSLLPVSALASTAPWVKVGGPPGAFIGMVVFDTAHPGVAFAGSDGGRIYRSADGGATWTLAQVGPATSEFRAIAVDPAVSGKVFAYSADFYAGATLYVSVDDGVTWKRNAGQPASVDGNAYDGRTIAIDPTGQIVVVSDVTDGILRSTNGGQSWSQALQGAVHNIAVDPVRPNTLWTAGRFNGAATIWHSGDFGATWQAQTPSVINPTNLTSDEAWYVGVQPGSGKLLVTWAGYDTNYNEIGSIAASTDGSTWTASGTGLLPTYSTGNSAAGIAFDPANPKVAIASANGVYGPGGLYYSASSGAKWGPVGGRLAAGEAFTVVNRPAETGYPAALLAVGERLYVSTDDAKTFQVSDAGMNADYIDGFVDDGLAKGGYYAATYGGLFHTTDSGKTWSLADNITSPQAVFDLAVDALSNGAPVYISDGNRVLKSSNGGSNWAKLSPPLPAGTFVQGIYADPRSAGHIYVLAGPDPSGTLTICASTDAGKSWISANVGVQGDYFRSLSMVFPANQPASTFIGLAYDVWTSVNGGASWSLTAAQPGPSDRFMFSITGQGAAPYDMMVSLVDPSTFTYEYYVSPDGGNSWTQATVPPNNATTLTANPGGTQIFATNGTSGVFETKDQGATWTAISAVLGKQDSQNGAVSFTTKSALFITDYDGGVFSAPYVKLP